MCWAYLVQGDLSPAKIFQTHVAPPGRGRGVGRLLIHAALKHLEEKQFLSVSARVVLEFPSNAFWSIWL